CTPSTASWFAWVSASMFLRCAATTASTSTPGTRKSLRAFEKSKSRKGFLKPFWPLIIVGSAPAGGRFVHRTMTPISRSRPNASRGYVASQQCSTFGRCRRPLGSALRSQPEPGLGIAQATVERRHRLHHIGRFIVKPDPHDGEVDRHQQG